MTNPFAKLGRNPPAFTDANYDHGPKHFINALGQRCVFAESIVCQNLVRAYQSIADTHVEYLQLVVKAKLLYRTSQNAKIEEQNHSRPSSGKQAFKELCDLEKALDKAHNLATSMHETALDAIFEDGETDYLEFRSFYEQIGYYSTAARAAARSIDLSLPAPKGAPKKLAAHEITKVAKSQYETLSGLPATYTTDPETSEVSGSWPDFLEAVFDALHIKASVRSQLKNPKVV